MIGESEKFFLIDKETLYNLLTSEIVTIYMMTKLLPHFELDHSRAEEYAKDTLNIIIMEAKKDGVYKYDDSCDKM